MLLFVGLGNPGEKHARNRHNIGFLALEAIARHHGFPCACKRFGGLLQESCLPEVKLLLFRPLSFMNESGVPVGKVLKFYQIPPESLVVFHDDLDLGAGKLRVKIGGGTAGHNGLRSLVAHVGPGFRRVRLGVGRPRTDAQERVLSYVLGDFHAQEEVWLRPLLDAIALNVSLLLEGRDDAFASRTHWILSRNQENGGELR